MLCGIAGEFVKMGARYVSTGTVCPSFSAPRLRRQSKCVNSEEMAEPKHIGNDECRMYC
jgi:hypothetical protein